MPIHGSTARLYANGYDLSSFFREGGPSFNYDTADTTVWGATSKTYIAGKPDATWSGEGIYDVDMTNGGKVDDVLGQALAGACNLLHLPNGDGLGKVAFIMGGAVTSYEITSPNSEVTSFSFEAQSNSGAASGRVLYGYTGTLPITANGNGTGLDDQSWEATPGATVLGGYASFQVINKGGGAGTLTMKVQHSTNDSTYADLVTFTGVTAKNQSQVVEVPLGTTINRYLRALWTLTGGTWDVNVSFARRKA